MAVVIRQQEREAVLDALGIPVPPTRADLARLGEAVVELLAVRRRSVLPIADDLDAVALEQQIKERTSR